MDLLAKHFFDYQSFVNLPHKAVQLHKTPPSQAGVDPTAAWAPKSMHIAGKNQPAPQARSNRNHVEARPGSHRHGRPSKLEFRNWGDRHGEFRMEKIVPHKDAWMAALDGDFKHFYESEAVNAYSDGLRDSLAYEGGAENVQLLTILTLTGRLEFITLTVKSLRGIAHQQDPYVRIQLFDGTQLVDERRSKFAASPTKRASSTNFPKQDAPPPIPKRTDVVSSPSVIPKQPARRPLRISQNLLFYNSALSHLRRFRESSPPTVKVVNHNGGPASVESTARQQPSNDDDAPGVAASKSVSPKRRHTLLSRHSSLGSISNVLSEGHELVTDLSESFLLRVQPGRLSYCHLLLRVYVRSNSPTPHERIHTEEGEHSSRPPSNLSNQKMLSSKKEEDVLIGGCVIGPLSPGRGRWQWRQMIRQQGTPVFMWHSISRNVLITTTDENQTPHETPKPLDSPQNGN